jgi:DNA modification methylase
MNEDSSPLTTRTGEKNVDLLTELIALSTKPGEVVCDLTAGSGSAMEAALRSKRRYIGFEQDWEMFKVGAVYSVECVPFAIPHENCCCPCIV